MRAIGSWLIAHNWANGIVCGLLIGSMLSAAVRADWWVVLGCALFLPPNLYYATRRGQ